jgi:hypothetical protein
MHSAICPSCGTRVEVDFLPVAGLVWCPKCQKMFSPPVLLTEETKQVEEREDGPTYPPSSSK